MQQSDDGVDFKPFFDMVVGVLFILLILIAAQMFFTQWGSTSEETSRDRNRRLFLAWEEEASSFLDRIARRLRAEGLTVGVDLVDKAISLPITEITAPAGSGAPRINEGRAALIGRTLADGLRCLPGQTAAPPAECPGFQLLRLGQVGTQVRLERVPDEGRLPPDRYAHLLSALVSAALLQATPDLLNATGSGGGPALQPGSAVLTLHPDVNERGLRGDLALRFSFERPVEPFPTR